MGYYRLHDAFKIAEDGVLNWAKKSNLFVYASSRMARDFVTRHSKLEQYVPFEELLLIVARNLNCVCQ